MTSRPRNIRRKDPAAHEDPSWQAQTEAVKTRGKASTPLEERAKINLDQIQDRSTAYTEQEGAVGLEVPSLDDDLLLAKRAQNARNQREEMRQGGLEEEIIELGPLEVIADTGLDEEVFEDLRGPKIKFGPHNPAVEALEDMEMDDEVSRLWEIKQIQKGMQSAGIKAAKEVKAMSERLYTDLAIEQQIQLLSFSSLDAYLQDLSGTIRNIEESMAGYKMEVPYVPAMVPDTMALSEKLAALKDLDTALGKIQFHLSRVRSQLDSQDGLHDILSAVPAEIRSFDTVLSKLEFIRSRWIIEYDALLIGEHAALIAELYVHKQMQPYDLLSSPHYKPIQELIDELDPTKIVVSTPELVKSVCEDVYLPTMMNKTIMSFSPFEAEHVERVAQFINDAEAIVGTGSKALEMFKYMLTDIFDDHLSKSEDNKDLLLKHKKSLV